MEQNKVLVYWEHTTTNPEGEYYEDDEGREWNTGAIKTSHTITQHKIDVDKLQEEFNKEDSDCDFSAFIFLITKLDGTLLYNPHRNRIHDEKYIIEQIKIALL